jgi:indolepyruvate ferredoxin oxidoreductase alpha subunit
MKREFGPQAIYPSDIGCYTLGMNLRAVDTFLDMGSGITLADGLYKASQITGDDRPILATIGDSTFLHSGLPPLINAVHTGARFVLVILDNHTTAMTGFQPTAASPRAGADPDARRVSLAELARACGASFVETSSPYEHDAFRSLLRRAYQHSQAPEGGVAVVIADWPCILDDPTPIRENPVPVEITAECDGCRYCVEAFECPALVLQSDGSRVDIERSLCVDCGQCIDACYKGFIVPRIAEPSVPAG